MKAPEVTRRLRELSQSTLSSELLESRLAAVSMRDAFAWSYSETKEIEKLAKEVRANIRKQRANEGKVPHK